MILISCVYQPLSPCSPLLSLVQFHRSVQCSCLHTRQRFPSCPLAGRPSSGGGQGVPRAGGGRVTHNSTPKRDAPHCTVPRGCCSSLALTSDLPQCSVSWGLTTSVRRNEEKQLSCTDCLLWHIFFFWSFFITYTHTNTKTNSQQL